MSVLVVAEHLRGQLRPITLELISAAKDVEGPTTVAAIAKEPVRFVEELNREASIKAPSRR